MAGSRLPNIGVIWAACIALAVAVTVILMFKSTEEDAHPPTEKYLGAHACKECHEEQYESWSKTRMASTFEVLKPGIMTEEKKMAGLDPEADYTHDEECLPCHTTGYRLRGGFVSIETTPEMAGVGCEACHGPGGMYARTVMSASDPNFSTTAATEQGLVYPPTEPICRKCHNENSPFVGMDYVFAFEERVKAGTHEHRQLKYQHSGQPSQETG